MTLNAIGLLPLILLVICPLNMLLPRTAEENSAASWLDGPKPPPWNKAGMPIPAAPRASETIDPRCRSMARPAELQEDRRLRDKGWDLVGPYQGGWDILVIQATASYDGMCRPRQYQQFVFLHGLLAGTLSPRPMDSRTDGALSRVALQNNGRLNAEYLRYGPNDALCCPSHTTQVEFEITGNPPVVQPVSAASSDKR